MLISNEACNVAIIITTLILGILAFTKDLAKKYPKLKPIDRLWFKILTVVICTLIGWRLSVIKDANSDNAKDAIRKTDEHNRKVFQETLFERHKADSLSIDSLRNLVQSKDEQIITAQGQTIKEIQGADLPWVQANIISQPGAPVINLSITNLRRIPTNSVMISFVDAIDYYNANFPATSQGGFDHQRGSNDDQPAWMFMKNLLYPALAPGKEYFFYQKSFKNYSWEKVDYEVDVSWRGGTYTYTAQISKFQGSFEVVGENFLYKGRSYNRKQFLASFFSGKNVPYRVTPQSFF
jgi:hypothetical protein